MFKKVLILSASAGAGHIRAAQAIERAFAGMKAAEEVRHVDTLENTNKIFRNLYSKAYIEMVNKAPDVLGWLYDQLDKPGGLPTAETFAKGLVFVIVNPTPGQEERNSDHLLEEGVAIRCNNLPALAYKIDRLLDDPSASPR